MYGDLGLVNELCIVIYVLYCLYGFVYYDLCILDKFMSAIYIVQSSLCIVFTHNGAVAAHYFPNNNVYCVLCIVKLVTSWLQV